MNEDEVKDLIFISGKIAAFREILECNEIYDDGKICVPAEQIIISVKNQLTQHEIALLKKITIPAIKYRIHCMEEYINDRQ